MSNDGSKDAQLFQTVIKEEEDNVSEAEKEFNLALKADQTPVTL